MILIEQDAKRLLMERLDECLKIHADMLDAQNIGSIYELQGLSELHYYLKVEHVFTPAEVEALLSFQDPLDVARWCWEENNHEHSFPICDLLKEIDAAQKFEHFTSEPSAQDKYTLLMKRLGQNYFAYRESLMSRDKESLIEKAAEITAMQEAYSYLTTKFEFRDEMLDDVLALENPLKRLDYQQEQGLMSSLALGTNQIEIERGLTTSSTAIFVPFTTCELFQEGEALYYGLNALSNNLIMANRKTLKNPNGLFLGTPGSGKSFSAKREIVNVFLLTEDDIIIADPENEYGPLVQQFGSQGQVIDISPTSTNYINPMDINLDYSDDENPITLKSDFILSLCDLIIGGKEGLSPIERTIIDRCTRLVYREYLQDPCPENMPILGDLYELLLKQSEPEAQNIATALEIYVNGSLNVFNHRSNIQMDKHRVLCFQLKSLGKALKEIGLLIMQDAVWNRVTANRSKHKTTWFYIDEFHLLLKGQTGSFSVEIWKRFRKWGGIPSGLTQNVKDLLASREIENIFENSDFIYMLNQAQGDRQILAKQLGISPHQLSYVTHSGPGEGLLFFGNVIIPFVDHFPKDTLLYSVLTTRPDTNNLKIDLEALKGSGVSVTRNGNEYTFTSRQMMMDPVLFEFRKNIPVANDMLIWGRPGYQTMMTGASDPVSFFVKFKTETYGTAKLVKTSEDGIVSGITFHISGTDILGNEVNEEVTTGENGQIEKKLLPGTYLVKELPVDRYVTPSAQYVTIESGQTSSVHFSNILKKFRVHVVKSDADTGNAQGDATLAGAAYGIFRDGELIDTYTTGPDGSFMTRYYVCGDGWTIREIEPSTGYLLNETIYEVGASPSLYEVELNTTENQVTETVIYGNIQLVKHTDDLDPDVPEGENTDDPNAGIIERPEAGAVFEVYLKAAGSYDAAKESERDLLTTDADGFASSKPLPYGHYTVHQIAGEEGKAFVPDFTVFISSDGKTYSYILNNRTITARLKVEKCDAETGKIIPVTGTGFQIKDLSTGEFITQTVYYPNPETLDTFYVSDEGWLMLPEPLAAGDYELYEVAAPYGYVLSDQPVPFTIDGSEAVVTVTQYNMPQKGQLTITKTGEVFASVQEND